MIDAPDDMDYVSGDPESVLDRERERLSPVIYYFNGGANRFRRAINPYV
jgi:hypothetical protein